MNYKYISSLTHSGALGQAVSGKVLARHRPKWLAIVGQVVVCSHCTAGKALTKLWRTSA